MKQFKKITALTLISVSLLAAAFSIQADSDALGVTSAAITMDQAVSIALQAVPGTAAKVEFEQEDNMTLWEVEVVSSDQQVFELEIDANSGEILEKQGDDDDEDQEDRD
jgi:uncharacterized membrane protein YkoI